MSATTGADERARDLDRFLTFLDAIVAIAITLLVLPLIDLVGDLPRGGSVHHLLWSHRGLVGAFLLSFLVISHLWLAQHRMLRAVTAYDERLLSLLLLWAATIVVLPFLTALVAAHGAGGQATTKVLYVGAMAMSSTLLVAVSRIGGVAPRGARDTDGAFTTTLTLLVALTVMLLLPVVGYWPLLLLIVSDRAAATVRSVGRRRSGTR